LLEHRYSLIELFGALQVATDVHISWQLHQRIMVCTFICEVYYDRRRALLRVFVRQIISYCCCIRPSRLHSIQQLHTFCQLTLRVLRKWINLITVRCTLVQSAVLPLHAVCLSVRPSATLVNC